MPFECGGICVDMNAIDGNGLYTTTFVSITAGSLFVVEVEDLR
jgi:hypothetical protein